MPCGRGRRVCRAADDNLLRDRPRQLAESVNTLTVGIRAPDGSVVVDHARTARERRAFIKRNKLHRRFVFGEVDGLLTYKQVA